MSPRFNKTARILLVEDTRDLARVIACSHQVFRTEDGSSALEIHSSKSPDLVILDWMLPGLNGLEVLRRLRQSSPTLVLKLTARGEEADRVIGLELGADDYPWSLPGLLVNGLVKPEATHLQLAFGLVGGVLIFIAGCWWETTRRDVL